jgi:Carboxypeptidase regulatory-like domain/TonB-dependent Receptor Plug Domain
MRVRRVFRFPAVLLLLALSISVHCTNAQTGNSANLQGTVTDPSGGVVAGATVEIHNPVSAFDRTTTSDASGAFTFSNVPFNPYHLSVLAPGFDPFAQDVDVRSSVPLDVKIALKVASGSSTVTVEGESGEDLTENDPTFHTDVDRNLFNRLPLESASSSVSSLVTLSTPGVAADSNGLFHGLGDHAENSFSVDGQPITDQQSKVFSNQIPADSIQSIEVISGAPPAEYGDKTSLVINVTTRSGQGVTTPHGSITASYGAFGTSDVGFDLAYGGQNWGNFISAGGLQSGRFLDPPEFSVMHDKGNQENIFDRVDYQFNAADAIHFNVGYTRSWFQTPNSFDGEDATAWDGVVVDNGGLDPNGNVVGAADQRSKIETYNIAPSWTHIINSNAVLTTGVFYRHDNYNYYPSDNPFADLGPPSLQRETVGQNRTLTNAGVRSSVSWVHGVNNIKAGVVYEQTFLDENDQLGIVDPTFNAPCLTLASAADPNVPVQGFTDPSQCVGAGYQQNVSSNVNAPGSTLYPYFNPVLTPYDLTRGGGLFDFDGHTDVKELALYVQDTINWKSWAFNLGIRGDLYNGLTKATQAEPRLGVAYNIKKTNTVLRASYARTLETPFNENLILSSVGCESPVLNPLLACGALSPEPLSPGFRNEFHAGFQQAFGKYLVVDGEYIWKYTHNGYDFSVLGDTPITFPIEWHNSKIPGYALRASVPNYHGITAFVVMSSVAARFFTPQIGGAGVTPEPPGTGSQPFRIDHDEHFNETTHLQYQPWKKGPWFGFNWRYDSGLVAGAAPCYGINPNNDCPQSTTLGGQPAILMEDPFGNPLSADQEFQAGFYCGGQKATPTTPLPNPCLASQFGSTLINVPKPNTEDDDHNPPRIASRNLFDIAIGDDNVFNGDRHKWSAKLTLINITNNYALYNFLSTFSGTHYVTPRAITGEIGFHF